MAYWRGKATKRKSQATRTERQKRPTLSASPCGRVNAPTSDKRATRAIFEPFTAQPETESESQTTHGTRECATSGEKRHALPTTPAESPRAAKGFKPRHGAQAEKIRKHSRRHPCKPHATQTERTSRGDPPTPHRSRTPRPIGEGREAATHAELTKTAPLFVLFTKAPRITPPSGEGKPRHAAISEREANAKRRKYPHLFRICKTPHNAPNFAAIAFLAFGGIITPTTPRTR